MAADFYTSQWDRLTKRYDHRAKLLRAVLAARYGDELTNTVIGETREEFDALIPQLPFIGKKNVFLDNLIESGMCLGLCQTLR